MAEILALSRSSLRKLLIRPRFWVSLLTALGCVWIAYFKAPAYLIQHGYRIQAAEPFLLLNSGRTIQMILLISFLLLVGDVPFLYPGLELTALRSSRRKWLAGQVLAALGAAALWLLFVLACTVLVFFRCVSFRNQWSLFLKVLARSSSWQAAYSAGMWLVSPRAELIVGASPYGSLGWMLLFQFLLFSAMTLWSLTLNLWTKRSYGCMLTVGFCVFRRFVLNARMLLKKDLSPFSPMSLVNLCEHRLTPERTVYIVFFFLMQICVLWVLSAGKLKRTDLSKSG